METSHLNYGAELLRDCVAWLNQRDEVFNQGKTYRQLIKEWANETCPDPNWYTTDPRPINY